MTEHSHIKRISALNLELIYTLAAEALYGTDEPITRLSWWGTVPPVVGDWLSIQERDFVVAARRFYPVKKGEHQYISLLLAAQNEAISSETMSRYFTQK